MEHSLLVQILMMLVIATVAIAVFRRLGLPAIIAYMMAGVISGPAGFNWFSQAQIHSVAELGVVLLMFSLGLEFSFPRLWAMRNTVFGLGSAQVGITALVSALVAICYDQNYTAAIVIGFTVALSSTAIVLNLLSKQNWLRRRHGELSVSMLLFQDLAVVPLLILLPLMAAGGQELALTDVVYGLFKGILTFVLLMSFGKWVLPKLFDEVARSRSNELFVLSTLVVALVTGAFTQWLGMSMALGAFMAGMLMGESQYRRQLEADIRPFRDLLMGLFFISIGMLLDFELVLTHWWRILCLLFAVVVGKGIILFVLLRLWRQPVGVAASTAMTLAQIGEFSFVVLALAVNYQLIDELVSTEFLMVAVLSMTIAPWLVRHSLRAGQLLQNAVNPSGDVQLSLPEHSGEDKVIILGYGRVGQTIARFLKIEAVPYVVLDLDPRRVTEARNGGEPVFFGDACKRGILKQLDIINCQMLVVTFSDTKLQEEVISLCRQLDTNTTVMVRTRDDTNLDALEKVGATQVIPENLEGSLMLVSQVLFKCGVPLNRILKRLESERRNHYRFLHGFFSGTEAELALEQLHAVSLPVSAYAVGQLVEAIPWHELQVELRAIRRGSQEIESPSSHWQMQIGDILLLQGKPSRVQLAEAYLLGEEENN